MKYPNRAIVKGESDKNIVKAIQRALNQKGYGPLLVDGDFGKNTLSAIKLFQAQNTDSTGVPLLVDGKIGLLTWEVLFGANSVSHNNTPKKKLHEKAIDIAISQLGVREIGGSNCGPEVETYLRSVGLGKGYAWCMAFVYWCFEQASKDLGKTNPLVKTGGVLKGWNESSGTKIVAKDAVNNPALVKPGQIFIMDYGRGMGHTGIVKSVNGGYIQTIEGNTNNNHSREGIGVFELSRKINSINKGFLQY